MTKSRPHQASRVKSSPSHVAAVTRQSAARKSDVHPTGRKVTAGKSAAAKPASGKSKPSTASARLTGPAKPRFASKAARLGKKPSPAKPVQLSERDQRRIFMSHLHPTTDRVTTIQEKLAEVGYLKEDPNGQWDDQTREAMRRYQQDNGFPATGLPESKSLMKLGLGPHPLPPELDQPHGQTAETSAPGGR